MNLILFSDDDILEQNGEHYRVRLQGRQHQHIVQVHQADQDQELNIGRINGLMGRGKITHIDAQQVEMQVLLDTPPPAPLPVTLILALPRPKMFKRIVQTIATMGIKELILLNSYRVDKSYWQTPVLQEAQLREQLILGLEQARDTTLPNITLEKRFKPFIEDRAPDLLEQRPGLLAHPGIGPACPFAMDSPCTLAIGPEGGFIQYEVDKCLDVGFKGIHLGPRILKVETAVPALLSRLYSC